MMANNMTDLLNKIERRLHMSVLYDRLPVSLKKEQWQKVIEEETLTTFSRYYPNKLRFVVDKDTCDAKKENGIMVHYIKPEIVRNTTILGVRDIDWTDTTEDNLGASQVGIAGIYTPSIMGTVDTLEAMVGQQMYVDNMSLYNNNLFVDFEEPNKIIVTRAGNNNLMIDSFVVILLIKHQNLATISPTKMETFEGLAIADVANFLYGNLKYFDGLELTYIQINLLLDELRDAMQSREKIIEDLENSYVTAANDNIPYIITING